jgi:hypothetical protein
VLNGQTCGSNQFLGQRKAVDELGRTFNRGRLFQASYNESEARVSHFLGEGAEREGVIRQH